MSDGENGANGGAGVSPNVKLASGVTVVALLVYLGAVIVMWDKADGADDTTWARLTFLLAGVEAIAFAAVGWLFGREVHRERAEKAEQGEEAARTEADEAKQRATGALATGTAMRRALEQTQPPQSDRLGGTPAASQPDLATLRAIARYFPEN